MGKVRAFVVPHWHFDALWQLTFDEYFEVTARNLADLLEFLEVCPEFRFNLDQTIYVEEFLRRFPELSDKLREAVRRGQVEFLCSGYTQPDSNVPSGEFLVRNVVLHQLFLRREFGAEAKCGWFIDVYGQSAQLPQIFKKANVECFAFWRGIKGNLPSEFLWEGIDGTRILTHRMPLGYGSGYLPTGERRYGYFIRTITRESGARHLEGVIEELARRASTPNVLVPSGGDFSPPQRELVEVVSELGRRREDVEVRIATASEFFKCLEAHVSELPVFRGEFNPIFRGTYSARIEIKKANREAENLYLIAERFATVAHLLGLPYPREELSEALKLILTNQFHDAINGEVTDEVYDVIMENYAVARRLCRAVLDRALRAIASAVDTRGEWGGVPVLVFNPLSWPRTDAVTVEVAFSDPGARAVRVLTWRGEEVPCQVVEAHRNPDGSLAVAKVVFVAEGVPPLGYKLYYAVPSESEPGPYETSVRASERGGWCTIENEYYSVTFDPYSMNVVSVYDKEAGREVLDCSKYLGNALFVEPDYGSVCSVNGELHAHQVAIPIKDPPGPEAATTMRCVARGEVVERGPVRVTVRLYGVVDCVKYTQWVTLYAKVKRIDFVTELEFSGERRRVRVVFPVRVEGGRVWHEIPYGAIERGEGEYPAINWVDISNDEYGVTLINCGIPGNSVVGNLMIMTLLRSIDAMYLDAPIEAARLRKLALNYLKAAGKHFIYYAMGPKALERGRHVYRYALYPHRGTWREAKSYKVALEANCPLIAVKCSVHEGRLPKEFSFASLSPDNLVLTVLKLAEDGDGVVARFYEAEGRGAEGRLVLFCGVERASEASLLEDELRPLPASGGSVAVRAKPFEIVTVRLRPAGRALAG